EAPNGPATAPAAAAAPSRSASLRVMAREPLLPFRCATIYSPSARRGVRPSYPARPGTPCGEDQYWIEQENVISGRTDMRGILATVLVVACALVYSVPWAGAAMMTGDIKKELQTAIFHASELAQRGNSVAASKLHLQHTINCLVGDTGSNFKMDAGYPCQGQGNGIIPDLKAAAAMNWPGAAKAKTPPQPTPRSMSHPAARGAAAVAPNPRNA